MLFVLCFEKIAFLCKKGLQYVFLCGIMVENLISYVKYAGNYGFSVRFRRSNTLRCRNGVIKLYTDSAPEKSA